ncbi:ribonuclease III domain-containing protein [Prochlorococcus marinus]|uniref:ribonuclease III domain-containing protein n=1 Tax=Prochlorococcus marinus TaxID=1219 RepID=UPI0022B4B782|nr:ribonuclease III domain-containing protein [Prochlorococcus marinus]
MTDWIRSHKSTISPDGLGPLQLAWLGDAVWEMHHRLRYCSSPMRSKDLHNAVVKEVNASSQAKAITKIEPFLNDTEKDLLRRGRNRSGRGPKNVDAATYAIATGFETIVGWLFLKNPNRLADLFDLLDRPIN